MLTLVIVRHAKSDQRFFGSDFERPLNSRGNSDAPVMARRLKEKLPGLNALVSSPAVRAKATALYFAAEYGLTENDIHFDHTLYHAAPATFFSVITGLPDTMQQVAIFSHNPGISAFANFLSDKVEIDDMPTCAMFAITVHANKWVDFKEAEKEFLFFDYPKK